MPNTILIVDDDPHIREVIGFALDKAGYKTVCAADGLQALDAAAVHHPSLLVLDIGMPEMDGLEVCRRLRATSQTPILFLSARDDEIDRVVGLEIGGDDYMVKPFSPRELVARVNAILKRSLHPRSAEANKSRPSIRGHLKLCKESRTTQWRESWVELTAMEFDLLAVMLEQPERVFSRDDLMHRAYDTVVVSDRTIDSHIRHIRKKFAALDGTDIVTTVHSIGYKLGSCTK